MATTPAKEKGFKIGDIFSVRGFTGIKNGSLVEFIQDDGTSCPMFRLLDGKEALTSKAVTFLEVQWDGTDSIAKFIYVTNLRPAYAPNRSVLDG